MTARCAPIPKADRMIYSVLCRYKDGLFWAERDASNADRATTINHIRNGNLWNVVTVLECNPVEGTCRDVTDDMLAAAAEPREPPPLDELADRLRGMLIDHERDLKREGLFGW